MAESVAVALVAETSTGEPSPAVDGESLITAEALNPVDDLLRGSPVGNLAGALSDIFAIWGMAYAQLDGKSPCMRAAAAQLECLQGKASLQKLRTIDSLQSSSLPEMGPMYTSLYWSV